MFGFLAAAGLAVGGMYYAYNAQEASPSGADIRLTSLAQPEQPEEMGMPEEIMPGDEHKWLDATFVGTWDSAMSWVMGPDAPAMTATATSTTKSMLDGRFFQTDVSCPDMGGMPFNGQGLMGYDRYRNQFVSTWVDNMTTTISTMTGKKSADGKSITLEGETIDPSTGQPTTMKMVYRIESKDKFVEEFYMAFGPDKTMEKMGTITNTRKR